MKDEHTYDKKMARKGCTKVIYKGTFVSEQSLSAKNENLNLKKIRILQQDLGG